MNALLLACLGFVQPAGLETPHVFTYRSEGVVKSVSVAGQFNNWNKDANPLVRGADGKSWSGTVNLKPGVYQYKFVIDGENWILDPRSLRDEPDGNGNTNSILVHTPADYKTRPAKVGDGIFTESAMTHKQEVPQLNWDRGQLRLTVTSRSKDVQSIRLVGRNGSDRVERPLRRVSGDELVELHEVVVPWNRKTPFAYSFEFTDGRSTRWLDASGLNTVNSGKAYVLDPMSFKPFEVPNWVEGTVFYQIFPDRFDNADEKNDPKDLTPWLDKPTYSNRYGGDAAGVSRRIKYLQTLGVNGIYFNPVMFAPSNHRYDPSDFYRIDPEFATNSEFVKLTNDLHNGGIRVVLDQIFDHVGVTFGPFADVLKFQEKSRFRDWFFIKEFPVEVRPNPPYVGWFGTEWMPKINLANPGAYSYLMESVDFWMANAKLSGWRLDVANETPEWFWRDFRKRVKAIDEDAWIVGEVWYDANPWLKGDQWDASMNYPFRDACLKFIAKNTTKPSQFVADLMNVHNLYAPQVSRNQLNLISSHDTPRFLHEAGGDRKLAALAAVVQFTWPGAPSVYYGEEIGMEGAQDPDNRRGMRWDLVQSSNELLSLYTRLTHLRTKSSLLAAGDPVVLNQFDSANVATFGRQHNDDFAVVVLNRGNKPFSGKVQLPAQFAGQVFVDALSGRRMTADGEGSLLVELTPVSALIGLNASNHHEALIRDANAAVERMKSIKEPLP